MCFFSVHSFLSLDGNIIGCMYYTRVADVCIILEWLYLKLVNNGMLF